MDFLELIRQSQAGNNNAMESLLKEYKNLVSAVTRGYFLIGGENEDLIQEGTIGLYKAIISYKENSGASFKTYASTCIRRQIATVIKQANRQKNKPLNGYLSINNQGFVTNASVLSEDEDEGLMFMLKSNTFSPEEEIINHEKSSEITIRINKTLSGPEKKILLEYLDGKSYLQIAQKFDKTVKSVDNSLTNIKRKLQFLKEEN